MAGVDATKWHLLRSCPLTPSGQGQGSQFAFTGGQRPWWSLVSSGLSVAASFPRRLAQSLNLRALSIGPAGIRGGRGVGTRTTLGPLARLSCGPGWGVVGRGVGVGKRETAAGSEYFSAGTVHGTMHDAGSTWRRVLGDVGPALGPSSVRDSSTARCDPYLIACIDPVFPTSAEKGSARGL